MSAGSSTSPGGYQEQGGARGDRQQFPVLDQRTPGAVVEHLASQGFRIYTDLAEFQAK
jgi:hypothetical protein